MKHILITFLLATTVSLAQHNATIDKNQQTLSWIGKAAVGNYQPEGSLAILNAEITYTENEITSLSIVVDMRSLEQENKQLQGHLRDKDFFYVKKYPVATFVLSESTPIEDGKSLITGKMTIKGTAYTEIFEASIFFKDESLTMEINQTMDRTNYGINYNSPSIFKKLKENAIADDFILKGKLVFTH